MTQRSRTILKTYFETGDVPTQAQFIDLIDSLFNLTDDSIDAESITATAGQTVFDFSDPVAGRPIFVNGSHYINTVDYTITGANQITLIYSALGEEIVTAEAKN